MQLAELVQTTCIIYNQCNKQHELYKDLKKTRSHKPSGNSLLFGGSRFTVFLSAKLVCLRYNRKKRILITGISYYYVYGKQYKRKVEAVFFHKTHMLSK